MIQRAESRVSPREVADRIATAIHPWRIVLFGSRARGDAKPHSDLDIYVEVDAETGALREVQHRIGDLFAGRGWTLDFKVVQRGTLERRRDDPGTIEWDVAREGKVLYSDPAAGADIRPVDRVRESDPKPPESTYEWIEAAERDTQHREDLESLGKAYWPEICWLSHQAVEKYMKALLVSRRARPERTHNLEKLLVALRLAVCLLPGLDADCKLLSGHAITPRYPAGNSLGPDDARAATEAANRVTEAVRAMLPPRLH